MMVKFSQSFENFIEHVIGISEVIIETKPVNDFVFIKKNTGWYQLYLDEKVLFVVEIEALADVLESSCIHNMSFNEEAFCMFDMAFDERLRLIQDNKRLEIRIENDSFVGCTYS